MAEITEPKNLVILCDVQGTITGVITDEVFLKEKNCISKKVTCLLNMESLDKATAFFDSVISDGVAMNYEMFIKTTKGKAMLVFSGIRIEEKILIFATDTNHVMNNLVEEMSRISNEQTNLIRRLAQEKIQIARMERDRIERDLHDTVSQTIFSTRVIAEILPKLWEKDRKEAKKQLENIKFLAEESLIEMRRILLELKPDSFDEEDLEELMKQVIKSASLRSNMDIGLKIKGKKADLDAKVKEAFYRILQESINNSIKHSGAKHLGIVLKYLPNMINLEIKDDGNGFDPEKISKSKYGLYIMKDRAKAIDALLVIKSDKAKGTKTTLIYKY
jgi:signal transduction histidine kinase